MDMNHRLRQFLMLKPRFSVEVSFGIQGYNSVGGYWTIFKEIYKNNTASITIRRLSPTK